MNELEIIHHRRVDGLSIFFDTVDYRTPHIHPEWELLWVLDNPLRINCGQESYVAEPGEIALFNPNELHELHKCDSSSTFLCLQVSSSIFPIALTAHVDSKLLSCHLPREDMQELRKSLSDMAKTYFGEDDYSALYCVGQSCIVLHRLLNSLPTRVLTAEENDSIDMQSARLKRLIAFVDENYMHKICLSDFAAIEGCSVSYLSRFIKETLNQNFQKYVTSVRFNSACRLIATENMRLLDVCVESGFSDYRYFCREFKRQFGMTPEEYKKSSHRIGVEADFSRRSIRSSERFYSKEESIELIGRYLL